MKGLFHIFGLILFSALAILGVLMVLAFFDLSGIHPEPVLVNSTSVKLPDLNFIEALVNRSAVIERKNPLVGVFAPTPDSTGLKSSAMIQISPDTPEKQPAQGITPPEIATVEPTATPIPPMDPAIYRTEVTLRAKNFASALEAFLTANDRLGKDETLIKDPEWRSEMTATLDQVAESGQALSAVGPPPREYEAIYSWLVQVGPEAENLRVNYSRSLESGDSSGFSAAGENFNQIKEDLSVAISEMAKAGWPLE